MPAKMPKIAPKISTTTPTPDWKRALSTGMDFTEMRRSQARSIVNDLVAQGHLAREQVSAAVDEVLEVSRRRSDDLRKVVRNEVQRQLGALGLATKADLQALERRVARAGGAAATKKKSPAAKKATAKKATAKARRGSTTKAAAKKASASPAPKAG